MEFDHVRRHVPPTILDDVKDGIQLIRIHLDIHVLYFSVQVTNCNFSSPQCKEYSSLINLCKLTHGISSAKFL